MEVKDKIKCHKCGKLATGRYSPDLDISGLAFCDEHKELMAAAFYCLLQNDIETFNQLLGVKFNPNESKDL